MNIYSNDLFYRFRKQYTEINFFRKRLIITEKLYETIEFIIRINFKFMLKSIDFSFLGNA